VKNEKGTTKKKPNFCAYCGIQITKLERHLIRIHKDEVNVKKFLLFAKGTVARKNALALIRAEGNDKHNVSVLQKKEGTLILARARAKKAPEESNPLDFSVCVNCKRYFTGPDLYRHKCPKVQRGGDSGYFRQCISLMFVRIRIFFKDLYLMVWIQF